VWAHEFTKIPASDPDDGWSTGNFWLQAAGFVRRTILSRSAAGSFQVTSMSDDKPDLHVVPVAPDGPTTPPVTTPDDEDVFTPDPLNAREALLVENIAKGESLADSATAAGISYRTARRWRLKPHLNEQIRNRVSENLAQTRAILSAGSSRAARGLVAMADPAGTTEPNSARVAAARGVLDASMKLEELENVIERLTKIEERLANIGGKKQWT
jgi:hypothetical protein